MDYLDRPIKKNPDGTIPFGRPAIKRPTPEFRERLRKSRELGKELGFDKMANPNDADNN